MAEIDDIRPIMATLKKAFRASGVRQKQIAEVFGVSLMTVKRMMSGKGMKLDTLIQLCAIIDLTVYELLEETQKSSVFELPPLTVSQLSALSENSLLGAIFSLIGRGWTLNRIAEELQLTDSEMSLTLAKLDGLKVIALYPGNRVRVLRKSRQMSDEISREFADFAPMLARVFSPLASVLEDPENFWNSSMARLSESSSQRARQLLEEVGEAIFALGERDLALPPQKVRWYATLFVARNFDISKLQRGANVADDPRTRGRRSPRG